LSNTAPIAYAEVSAANEHDLDSTPENGTPPNPNEDDEASTSNGLPILLPDLVLTNLQIPSNGNPGDLVNFTFNLNNIGTSPALGDYTVGVYWSTNNTFENSDILVGDVLTGNTPVGTIADVPAVFTIPVSSTPGTYYIILKADIHNAIHEHNELNNTNSRAFNILGNGSNIDLELSISVDNPSPSIYSYYSNTLTLVNKGFATATGIQVDFPKNNGVSYYGGNEYYASQGSFTPHSSQVWNVGSLASGGIATLTVNYFILESNPLISYAQVLTAIEPDSDSTPGNGECCTVVEDDEAAMTTSPVATYIQAREMELENDYGSQFVSLLRVYPNPGDEQVNMVFEVISKTDMEAVIFDAFGNKVLQQMIQFEEGINIIQFNIERLPSGVYAVLFETPYRQKPAVFIKGRF